MHRFAKLFNDIKLTILSVRRVDKSCSLNLSLFFLFFVLLNAWLRTNTSLRKKEKLAKLFRIGKFVTLALMRNSRIR